MSKKVELLINNAYPRNKVYRNIRFWDELYKSDVRMFLQWNDYVLEDIVRKNKLMKRLDHDETIRRCMQWIKDNVEYKRDYVWSKVINNFQVANVTAQRGYWDCEDTSILLIKLALAAKVPYYKLKFVSWVVQKSDVAPEGGHAWVFFYNKDWEWEIIETTSKTDAFKGLAKDLIGNSWYKRVNYTVNSKYSFAQKEIKETDDSY